MDQQQVQQSVTSSMGATALFSVDWRPQFGFYHNNFVDKGRRSLLMMQAQDGDTWSVCFAGFALVQTPQFARGNVFTDPPPQQKLQEQDQYKSFLKQQVALTWGAGN